MIQRRFYAAYNKGGINTVFKAGMGWKFFGFKSKAKRDWWVAQHQFDENGNTVAQEVASKYVTRCLGKEFFVPDGEGLCVSGHDTTWRQDSDRRL